MTFDEYVKYVCVTQSSCRISVTHDTLCNNVTGNPAAGKGCLFYSLCFDTVYDIAIVHS